MQNQDSQDSSTAKRISIFLGAACFFITGMMFFELSRSALNDPDTWWHIKTGQDILANLKLPTLDSYSHTYAGHPWIAKEWLSQIILAASYNLAGWNGVIWIAVVAVAAALTGFYFEIVKSIHPVLSLAITILVALSIGPVVLARPHVFTFIIAIFFASRLFRSAENEESPDYWLLLLVTLWANLHGSFTLAFIIAAFAFAMMLEKTRLKNRALIGKWLVFLILCPVASFIHPYGYQPFLINFSFISGLPVMSFINEWQPFNANTAPIVEIGLLAFLASVVMCGVRLSISKTLLFIFTLHMMLIHARFVYIFFLLVPIMVCPEAAIQNPKISFLNWSKRTPDNFEIAISKYLTPIIAVAAFLTIALFVYSSPYAPPPERKIEAALQYVRSHHLDGAVLNSFDNGGPLIFNDIKTFIDGRAEQLFLGDFLTNYQASGTKEGAGALSKLLQTYNISWAILVPDDPRIDSLVKVPNWKKTYSDPYAVVLERN